MHRVEEERMPRFLLGIDLGGRKGRTTAFAMLSFEENRAVVNSIGRVLPEEDEFLIRFIVECDERLEAAGLDSPFDFPICVRCQSSQCPGVKKCDDIFVQELLQAGGNPYLERLTEVNLREGKEEIRPIPTTVLGPVVARTKYILKRLRMEGFPLSKIVEVYPKGTLITLARSGLLDGGETLERAVRRYKGRGQTKESARSYIVESLSGLIQFGDFTDECVASDDSLDAVVAAFTAGLFSLGLTCGTPDAKYAEEGWIQLPDRDALARFFKVNRFPREKEPK